MRKLFLKKSGGRRRLETLVKRRYMYSSERVIDRWNRAKLHSDPFSSLSLFFIRSLSFFFFIFFLLNEVTVSWQRHLTAMSSTARREGGHLSKQMDNTKKCENHQTKERQKKENKWWTATESRLKVFPEPLGEREKIKWRSVWKWWKQVGPHKQQRSSRRNTTIR